MSIHENYIVWSQIGSAYVEATGVVTGAMFTPPFIDGSTDGTDLNESGVLPLGSECKVRQLIPLGKAVIAYCSNKIFALVATDSGPFGVVPLHEFGTGGIYCAAGDEHGHFYIDNEGKGWKIGEDLKPKYLGYKEFFSPLLSGTVVITHNPNLDDYYITNGTTCYLLSPYGMTRVYQCPASLVWESDNKRLIGHFYAAAVPDLSAYIITDTIDFGTRGFKTIETLEVGGFGQTLQARVDNRHKMTGSFVTGLDRTVNTRGIVSPKVSGVEFRIKIKGADYTTFYIDYINVRHKYDDKRSIRGVYAQDVKAVSRSGS